MAIPCPVRYEIGLAFDVIFLNLPLTPGFWQYGIIDWEMFYSCLRMIIFSPDNWAIFRYDESAPEGRGAFYPPSHDFPEPGTYILLRSGI